MYQQSRTNPNNYIRDSSIWQRIAETHDGGVLWANQFDNTATSRPLQSTGPEIWEQTDHKIDGFICAVGSGGTIAGVGKFLKEQNQLIKVGLADPEGSALFSYYRGGDLKSDGNRSGIGQGRITANLAEAPIDILLVRS